jgi:hypothetical protein
MGWSRSASRDLALAAKEYARAQRLSAASRNYAWEIQIEAERRAAEFLKGLERKPYRGGVRQAHVTNSDYQAGLEQIGISTQDASRWQDIGEVPSAVVSKYVQTVADNGGEATTKGLLAFSSAKGFAVPCFRAWFREAVNGPQSFLWPSREEGRIVDLPHDPFFPESFLQGSQFFSPAKLRNTEEKLIQVSFPPF